MKVGVIADTHDRLPTFRRALALFERLGVEAIFHAGDFVAPFAAKLIAPGRVPVPVHCCLGNNDGERDGLRALLPQLVDGPVRVELAGRTIVMQHFVDWLKPQDIVGADIVITGHTHEVVQEQKGQTLFLNPGECCGWVNDRCTVATLDLETLKSEIIEVHG